MAREKTSRNHSGSIFKREISKHGKTVQVFDARKRYQNRKGENQEKFRRCASNAEAAAALIEFQNEINRELNILTDDYLIEFFIDIKTGKVGFAEFKKFIKTIENENKNL